MVNASQLPLVYGRLLLLETLMKMSCESAMEKGEIRIGTEAEPDSAPSITAPNSSIPPAELLLPQFNSPGGTLVGSPLTDGISILSFGS